jgi:hypothetical protein
MARVANRTLYLVAFLGLAVIYYYFHGPGPTPSERALELPWWRPLGWAHQLDWALLAPLQGIATDFDVARHEGRWDFRGLIPLGLVSLPPVLLTVLGFFLFRSALVRVLLLAVGLTQCAFVYYGWLDPATWEDYAWRWPIALFVTAGYLSVFALGPALVRTARARRPAVQVLGLLAFFVPVFLLTTEVTGTNPNLEWNLSPWPMITLYGFLLFGLVFGVVHLCAGLGLATRSALGGATGIVLGVLVATLLATLLRNLPFARTDLLRIAVLAVPAAVLTVAAGRRRKITGQAASLVAAGLVILVSVKLSQWQAESFQAKARDEISPAVIAALERHRADRGVYPLELSDLVPDYLAEIPSPRVGWLGEGGEAFNYIDLGDSFLLEFSCAMWVQCHYSPPYREEPLEPDVEELASGGEGALPPVATGADEDEELEAAWSCEPRPPRLW